MNKNLNFEAVKGYHINLRKLNDDQTKFITENLIKDYRDFEGDNNLFHYAYSTPNNEYRFFNFTCFSLGVESEEISFDEYFNKLNTPKNDVYSNSEFNSERFETKCGHVYIENKRIIGFNIIDDKYTEPIAKICEIDDIGDFKPNKQFPYSFSFNCDVATTLKDLNVLYIWCEPVFKDESITLKSGKVLTESEIEEVKEILKNK